MKRPFLKLVWRLALAGLVLLGSCDSIKKPKTAPLFGKEDAAKEPVSETAWFCCGARAEDARRAKPVCGDAFAERFLTPRGREVYEYFRPEERALASVVSRHRIIDDRLREELSRKRNLRIVNIGAGFDSRPYRLQGGEWLEVDERQLVAWKNRRLPPGQCPNSLRRIGIDFGNGALARALSPHATNERVAVVIEGVFLYLTEDQIAETLRTVRQAFPNHLLICDLMSSEFMDTHAASLKERVKSLGTDFVFRRADPAAFIESFGYRPTLRTSIPLAPGDRGGQLPALARPFASQTLKNGYVVATFEPKGR